MKPLSVGQLPRLPEGFDTTGGNFDLALSENGEPISGPVDLNEAITITINLTGEVISSAAGREADLIIQHYRDAQGWRELPTTVDSVGTTAQAQVDSLSIFALTVRRPVARPTTKITPNPPTPTPTATLTPSPTTTPTQIPTPVAESTATPTPTPTVPTTQSPAVRYELDTEVEPANLGSVSVRPSSDDGTYTVGRDVVLTAQCATAFRTWEGSVPEGTLRSSRTITVPMDRDRVLVAICLAPTSTPTPTPTATPKPTPTPGFHLFVNGSKVAAGQIAVRVPGGNVILHQLAQSNGTYLPGSTVLLEAQPDVTGSPVSWQGVISTDGSRATVVMNGERFVVASITTSSATPVPTATATPTATPTPVPTPGPTPTPTHTPTPQPPGEPTHTPTPTPTATPTPTPTPTATPTPTPTSSVGNITFQTNRDGNSQIYVMEEDGSSQVNVSKNSFTDSGPSWSPDGSKIVFVSDRDGNNEIYVMNSDGTSQSRLTDDSGSDDGPAWSLDGTKIAYGAQEIFVMDPDGSNKTNLTNNGFNDSEPSWCSDGRIVFASLRGSWDIFIMNADGTGETQLTAVGGHQNKPACSSSMGTIAYEDGAQLRTMNLDGSNQVTISVTAFRGFGSWSPARSKILFTTNRDGNDEIYVMNADGSNQVRITSNSDFDGNADWKP